jgi:hypothetical protein
MDLIDLMDDFIFFDNAESPLGPLGPSGPFQTLYAGAIPVFFNLSFYFLFFCRVLSQTVDEPTKNPQDKNYPAGT